MWINDEMIYIVFCICIFYTHFWSPVKITQPSKRNEQMFFIIAENVILKQCLKFVQNIFSDFSSTFWSQYGHCWSFNGSYTYTPLQATFPASSMLMKGWTHSRCRHLLHIYSSTSISTARIQSWSITSENLHACPPLKVGMGSKWISLTRSLTGW